MITVVMGSCPVSIIARRDGRATMVTTQGEAARVAVGRLATVVTSREVVAVALSRGAGW